MTKEQIVAIIQRGYFTDGDLADALLAELAKVSEPAGFIAHNPGGFYEGSHIPAAPYDYAKFHNGLPTAGTKLFTHPLPQPDLVAENERLVKALEDFISAYDSEPSYERQCTTRLALESMGIAIATHKSRKE